MVKRYIPGVTKGEPTPAATPTTPRAARKPPQDPKPRLSFSEKSQQMERSLDNGVQIVIACWNLAVASFKLIAMLYILTVVLKFLSR